LFDAKQYQWFHPTPLKLVAADTGQGFFLVINIKFESAETVEMTVHRAQGGDEEFDVLITELQAALV
jgi:hypothetical protein